MAAGGGKKRRGGLRRKITGEIKRRENEAQALALARAGVTYEEIRKALGYKSKGTIHELIHRALDRIPVQAAEAYRKAEDQRIEALMETYTPLAMAGDMDAARVVTQLIAQRAKLMGLNAPERAPVDEDGNTVGGADGFDAVAILAGRIARVAAKRGTGEGAGGADA